VDTEPAQRPELAPPRLQLPRTGLDELLRGWSGEGQLLDALAAARQPALDVEWSAGDLRRRADRVLLGRLEDQIGRLPGSAAEWLEHLPVMTEARTVRSRQLVSPTSWVRTVRQFGWPPSQFVGPLRSRIQDETTLTALAWCGRTLQRLSNDVQPIAGALAGRLSSPIVALVELLEGVLADVPDLRPSRLDLQMLRSAGRPWTLLGEVVQELVRAETDLEFLAYQVIEPDPELQWRLFHISVLGTVLSAMRANHARIRWLAPLSASLVSGPQFRAVMPDRESWDIWFEADAAPGYYGYKSPYRRATAAVSRSERGIGADIMVVSPLHRALILECKWSASGVYVGRDGYHQIAGYALEARERLAPLVWSFIVGPIEVVPTTSTAHLGHDLAIVLGATNGNQLPSVISRFLGSDSASVSA
jgi:hypothetical protein